MALSITAATKVFASGSGTAAARLEAIAELLVPGASGQEILALVQKQGASAAALPRTTWTPSASAWPARRLLKTACFRCASHSCSATSSWGWRCATPAIRRPPPLPPWQESRQEPKHLAPAWV
jgi:hypothetical protein